MATKHLKSEPHIKSGEPGWWWYEERDGIVVVLSAELTGDRVVQVSIPWRSLRAALERRDSRA